MSLWGNTDAEASRPKFVPTAEQGNLVFIDRDEASTQAAKEKGMSTCGWYLYRTFTDVSGTVRHKSELLVAMSVSAEDAGDSDDIFGIIFKTHPASSSVVELADATFTVVVGDVPATETLTYQWQRSEAGSNPYVDVSGATSSTYTITPALADTGAKFRCVVGVVSESVPSMTSNKATLTVTALS